MYQLLTPNDDEAPAAVRLLNSDWLFAHADALAAATTNEERAALALPCRQELERNHPEAFLSVKQVRKLTTNNEQYGYKVGGTNAIAVGAISQCAQRANAGALQPRP
jgi:hypothetical protein